MAAYDSEKVMWTYGFKHIGSWKLSQIRLSTIGTAILVQVILQGQHEGPCTCACMQTNICIRAVKLNWIFESTDQLFLKFQ